jgi:predicted ATPase/class 3 adenylate cyclase
MLPDPSASSLTLTLFGPCEVLVHGRPLPRLRSRKGLWLLALLALRRDRDVERSWLAGTLWPDSDAPQAASSLRTTLTDLRRALGPEAERLSSPTSHTLRLDLGGAVVDVIAFDAAVTRADAASLAEAVALYRGPLLEGCEEEWAFQEREAREEAYLQAREQLAADCLATGDAGAAAGHLRAAVAVDPLRETAQRGLMEALAAGGNYAAAGEVYRELRDRLYREMNAEPAPETAALYQAIRAEARERSGVQAFGRSGVQEGPTVEPERLNARTPEGSLPGGEDTVTFLFTDIEGSTRLWEADSEAMRAAVARHDTVLRTAIEAHEGHVFKTVGDGFYAAFSTAPAAVAAAVTAQRDLAAQLAVGSWQLAVENASPSDTGSRSPSPSPTNCQLLTANCQLRVRMALYTGTAELRGGDYFGPPLNRAARLLDAGHGGQILLSQATRDLVERELPAGANLRDLGEHRLKDVPTSERLFQLLVEDLPADFPPLRTLSGHPGNLPAAVTTFIGREREVEDLLALLAPVEGQGSRVEGQGSGGGGQAASDVRLATRDARLVTVTGPGGSGKTRLALEVAGRLTGRFPDGIWLVDLADIREPDNVAPQIAAAVRLPLHSGQDTRAQLLDFFREQAFLLILDNFEQVLGASLLLADLLQSASRVQCLVTSQVALRLRGERVYTLPPLRLPDAEITDPAQLAAIDSVALFWERAREVRTEFDLTTVNAPAIGAICRRLDGIPLAIELAAAQVADMSVLEVLEGLEARLDTLWSESPDVPERHRTLRAAIDWSYALLSPAEQRALQQLSVFAGGWFREAVPPVCGAEGLAALRVLHRHSLVNSTETPDGRTRYSLLETVRQYARAALEAEPAASRAVAERHREHYLQFAEERVARMRTRAEATALEELVEELDNLRAAMDGAQQPAQGERCARLAHALYEVLYRHGFWEEARARLQAAWTATAAAGPEASSLRAAISRDLASLAQEMGDLPEARRQAENALALSREREDGRGAAEALNLLGLFALKERHPEAARPLLEEALMLLAGVHDARRGVVLHNLALLASHQGDVAQAIRLYEESLTHLRAAGDLRGEAETLGDLGACLHRTGDTATAQRRYREALDLWRPLRDHRGIATMLHNLGEVAELDGNLETALALFVHAERLFRDLRSVYATESAAALHRLAEPLGAERWEQLRAAAEQTVWEEVVTP